MIQAGDRLAILAELHYGNQTFIDVLLAANPHIEDANRIFAAICRWEIVLQSKITYSKTAYALTYPYL